jgi:catechol 2,3-dioxygenase-like lactoylglutathione lyase family enzyme
VDATRAAISVPEKRNAMVRNFDHITIVVRDVAAAKGFFALLGFKEIKSVVISGKIMEDYMGIKGIEADHVALAIENPHTEVQLLSYRHPEMIADTDIAKLNKVGFNHICFAVDNLEAEVAKLTAAGVKVRNHMMDFHDRKLVFVYGPRRRDRRTGAVALIPAALRPCRGWGERAHIL